MNIIGAGPAGLYTAYLAARKGIPVTVHEEHLRIGKPDHCTGVISRNLRQFVRPDPEAVVETLKGAVIRAGREAVFLERADSVDVIDRTVLDRQLAEMAMSEGARIQKGRRVLWSDFRGLVVAAEGAVSRTRFDFGQRTSFLPAMQFDLREKASGLDGVCELWYGPWAPEFFAWVVPRGDRVRVGMAGRDLRALKPFVLRRFGRFRKAARHAGLVVTGGPVEQTYFRQREREVVLVGDAAGHVKPTTGGGVVFGLRGAECLADSFGDLLSYQGRWQRDFGRELKLQKLAMKLILRKPEAFVRFLGRSKDIVEKSADMEKQSRFAWKALPSLARWAVEAFIKL